MPITVTSDKRMDQFIAGALTPEVPTPFKELFDRAQAVLTELAKSVFFRRYIAEKIREEAGVQREFLRIARSDNGQEGEWLVLTADYKLKFWRPGTDPMALELYDLEGHDHVGFLLSKATDRLRAMNSYMPAMRYLISRFGEPSFTVADIEAESSRNGTIDIVLLSDRLGSESLATAGEMLKSQLENLQFRVRMSTQLPGVMLEDLQTTSGAETIFVLELLPGQGEQHSTLWDQLPNTIRQRFIPHNALAMHFYRSIGYCREMLRRPSTSEIVDMEQETLLDLLNTMFAN